MFRKLPPVALAMPVASVGWRVFPTLVASGTRDAIMRRSDGLDLRTVLPS